MLQGALDSGMRMNYYDLFSQVFNILVYFEEIKFMDCNFKTFQGNIAG